MCTVQSIVDSGSVGFYSRTGGQSRRPAYSPQRRGEISMRNTRISLFGLMATLNATAAVFAANPATYVASGSPNSSPDANGSVDVWSLSTQANNGGSGDYQGGPGNSWVLYSYGWPVAGTAIMDHTFVGGALAVGQTVSIEWGNRAIATGQQVGVAVMSGANQAITLRWTGGTNLGTYDYSDGLYDGRGNGVGFMWETLTPFIVTVTSPTTYLASWRGNQWTGTYNGGTLDGFRVFNKSAGDYSDVFSNNFKIGALPTSWAATAGGNWSAAGSWTNGSPNAAGASAVFGPSGTTQTVNVDGGYTVQSVVIDSGVSYTFNGTGSITLQGDVTSSNISVRSGSHTIAVPVNLTNDSSAIDVGLGATLSVKSITGAGKTLTKGGEGVMAVGDLNLGFLSVVGGTLALPSESLPHTPKAVVAGGLYVLNDNAPLGTRTYQATIDVGTSDIIFRGVPLNEVSDLARSGQNGPTLFTGTGLISSAAAADASGLLRYAVGVIPNNIDGSPIYDTFDGKTVSTTDVLVKFTYFGDADLNGIVDDTDFFLINNGFLNNLTGWLNGDFDYSGVVDDTDFFLINNGYLNQGAGLRAGGSVPEPTGTAAMVLVGAGLLARRRR
jgi:hypothetical protein